VSTWRQIRTDGIHGSHWGDGNAHFLFTPEFLYTKPQTEVASLLYDVRFGVLVCIFSDWSMSILRQLPEFE
jgi:hypothetical protein